MLPFLSIKILPNSLIFSYFRTKIFVLRRVVWFQINKRNISKIVLLFLKRKVLREVIVLISELKHKRYMYTYPQGTAKKNKYGFSFDVNILKTKSDITLFL